MKFLNNLILRIDLPELEEPILIFNDSEGLKTYSSDGKKSNSSANTISKNNTIISSQILGNNFRYF